MSEVVIRPGDVLIVGTAVEMTEHQAHVMKERLAERLPGLADVVVITGAHLLAAYRPNQSGDADA